ncbi:uncharacterized protein LOC118227592 isoform X4 [Anguilla anguilla]|uniref:uncharacterized protein LOC118227592 isoform X4 n=1 Tax=Anguilla anguilla TaxID=7936 RepID=UPI0015AA0FCA|nr:uncharacterized protein LOC118227592 isoform X4 [Anguilla anguilla]
MTTASFGVLVGLLLAQLAVYCVGLSVRVGHSLTLPCHGAPSRDVEWRFQQYEYPDWLLVAELHTGSFSPGGGFQGRVESFYLTEPGNYSLTLSPVVYSDLGIYECRYMEGTLLSHMKIEIRVSGPSNVSVAMGMSASLPCFGNIDKQARAGDLDVLWKRRGENVYQLHKNTITYGPRFENRASVSPEQALYGNMSLTIRQTWFSDEDDYQCFYSSPKESGNPDSVRLVVTGHPPQTLTVKAGGLLSIPLYTADPVRVTFSAGLGSDEVLMLDANKGPARYEEHCAQRCELLAQNYTLLLWNVTLEDAGVYKVTDPETNRTIGSVSVRVSGLPRSVPDSAGDSAGLPAGAVAGIVLLVLALLAVVCFVVWKYRAKFSRPPVSVPETQPSHPEPSLPLSEIQTSPAEPRLSEPETKPSDPELRLSEPETQPQMPETHPLMPETHPQMPETHPQMPETQPLMPETQPLMPEAQPLMPETQPLMPETQPLMPETQPQMPETQPLMPETQPFDQNEKLEKGDGIL